MPIKDDPETALQTRAMVKLATSALAVPASAAARLHSAGATSLVCASCRWCCICHVAQRPPSQLRALLDASREFLERPSASPVKTHVLDPYDSRITDNLELCRQHLTLAILRSVRTVLRTRMMAQRAREAQSVPRPAGSRAGARSGALSRGR